MRVVSSLTVLIAAVVVFFAPPAAAQNSPLVVVDGPAYIIDLRYNSSDNFLHENLYKKFGVTKCLVRPEMAQKLANAAKILAPKNIKLVMWDCYRPLEVQRAMWEIKPDARYVANPSKGSNHNRGAAVDVSLANNNGLLLEMPTPFDDFTPRAAPNAACRPADKEKCANRDILKTVMKEAGLVGINSEWWHYELPGTAKYPLIEKQ